MTTLVKPSMAALSEWCEGNHVRCLALFGSALTERFRPESDIDLLVEFETGKTPGFFGLARMESELGQLFGGRQVDLRTPEDLSRYFRDEVIGAAEVLYQRS
ncbi:MAG: nucleotidyltransferase domain-containing protein [Chloroflexi bacterium]|nr:nucleotidyltransferase domain-containing protein [Chloroflexota bacterium]